MSVSLCHFQHHTLIQGLLWMCALTSCLVSGARGPPIEGDPSAWTCATIDSLIDDGLTTGAAGGNWSFEGAESADEMSTCGWNESTTPKIHNPRTRPLPPTSMSYEGDGLVFQEEGTATCTEDYEPKSRVTASTTRTCHLDGYTSANTGWQFTICVTTTVLPCFDSTLAQNTRLHAPDRTNSTKKQDLRRGLRNWP